MKKHLRRALSSMLAATLVIGSSSFIDAGSFSLPLKGIGYVDTYAAEITAKAAGWKESVYAEWLPVSGAAEYQAFVKPAGGSYTQLDDELIRQYNTYCRVDALGLKAGSYVIKIVALDANGSEIASTETEAVTAENYNRNGFAFASNSFEKGTGLGGYNADGTPKTNAQIIYITDENKNTIKYDIITDSKGKTTTGTGLGEIIKLFEKGYETRPFIFRFVGEIAPPYSKDKFKLDVTDEEFHAGNNNSYRILDVKDNLKNIKTSGGGITFEGVGSDTTLHFNFNLTRAKSVEIRNLAFKDMTTSDEDGITVTSQSTNFWLHNNEFFYGGQGSDKDQAKGDGAADIKNTPDYGMISENHFWDTGKSSLCGLKESGDYHVTYALNWFDHSDSRHPRIRGGSIHIYNNYFDGNSKYGVGMTSGGSAFVEGNYFRNVNDPMMISKQGTDGNGTGTFSGEDGGIIKVYNNIMAGNYKYIEGTIIGSDGTKTYDTWADGYSVTTRDEKLPSTLTATQGGSSYNNFDTTVDLGVSASQILAPEDVPAYVMKNAGRVGGGNFRFDFIDEADDTDYSVNQDLVAALEAYRSEIITIGGKVTVQPDTTAEASSMTGVDGNKEITERDAKNEKDAAALPTETQPEGNKAAGGSGVTVGDDENAEYIVLVPSDVAAKEYASNVTEVGTNGAFDILATSDKKVTVSSSKGIQLGGAGSTTSRAIVVRAAKAGKLSITASSTGSDTRTLAIVSSNGTSVGEVSAPSGGTVEIDAGTYYIYSTFKGINVSKVIVTYNAEEKETLIADTATKIGSTDDYYAVDAKNKATFLIHGVSAEDAENYTSIALSGSDAVVAATKSDEVYKKLVFSDGSELDAEEIGSDYIYAVKVEDAGTAPTSTFSWVTE